MPRLITSPWAARIDKANTYYKKWENRFRCRTLENYWEGFQWALANGLTLEEVGIRRPYTVNLVYTTIRRKIAMITYSDPEFILEPMPGHADWNPAFAMRSAQIKQDVLNTIVANPKLEIVEDIRLAALDSFFRFGVCEVGYAEDFLNPNKPKMEMKSHENLDVDPSKDRVVSDDEPEELLKLYTKWIPAQRFRVSMADDVKLRNCDWCGYYFFVPRYVLQNTKGIQLPSEFKNKFYSLDAADSADFFKDNSFTPGAAADLIQRGEMLKVWKIWDNVAGEIKLILEGEYDEIYAEDFERINLATHRFDLSLKGWYPIPPVWQWLSPQNEINEAREQMRKYRRRSTRKFEATKGDHDPDELDKLKTEEDGSVIVTKRRDGQPSVRPIQNPDLNLAIEHGLVTGKDDFDIVAAIPVARGRGSDRQTATATKKISEDQAIVESLEQIDFARFVSAIGREILLQTAENGPQGLWIKLTVDPSESILTEVQHNAPIFQYILTQDLADGYDFGIKVNVTNSIPSHMAEEEAKYVKFITYVNQFPQIAMSPILVRETAIRVGYKNERVIAEFQKMAILLMMEKTNQAKNSLLSMGINPTGGNATNQGRALAAQTTPNSMAEIQAQIMQQVQ